MQEVHLYNIVMFICLKVISCGIYLAAKARTIVPPKLKLMYHVLMSILVRLIVYLILARMNPLNGNNCVLVVGKKDFVSNIATNKSYKLTRCRMLKKCFIITSLVLGLSFTNQVFAEHSPEDQYDAMCQATGVFSDINYSVSDLEKMLKFLILCS